MDVYFSQPIPILALIFNALSIAASSRLLWMKRKDAAIFSVSRLRALFFLTALTSLVCQFTNVIIFVFEESEDGGYNPLGLFFVVLHFTSFYSSIALLSLACIERYLKLMQIPKSHPLPITLKSISILLSLLAFALAISVNFSSYSLLVSTHTAWSLAVFNEVLGNWITICFDVVLTLFIAWSLLIEFTLNFFMVRRTLFNLQVKDGEGVVGQYFQESMAKHRQLLKLSSRTHKLKRRLFFYYAILVVLAAFMTSIFIACQFFFKTFFFLVLFVGTSVLGVYIYMCMALFDLYVEGVSSMTKSGAVLKKYVGKAVKDEFTPSVYRITVLSSVQAPNYNEDLEGSQIPRVIIGNIDSITSC